MKKLVVILVALFASYQMYSQNAFNPTVSTNPVTVSTNIWLPLSIVADPNNANNHLGNLIQNQTRTYEPKIIYLFTMTKEPGTAVRFDIYPPVQTGGLTDIALDCGWQFVGAGNNGLINMTYNTVNGEKQWIQWRWDTFDEPNFYARLYVNSATPTATAARGLHTFTVHINGWYESI